VSSGRVALVGAGPGDPSLLTVRAVELLRAADVVAYDELVSEAILALVAETTELLPVGRRAGKGSAAPRLHPDVLERASRGLFVVRLKAGDPLVFGRGGEEAEELTRAGIPFEIVPGISAALGAAAYSAIPLTHRDLSAQVIFSSGHRVDGGAPPEGPSVAGGRTLALYMAAHELEANLAALVAAGWAATTPAALVIAATTADEQTITGTLATLAARAPSANAGGRKLPALVFVGGVVGLRAGIDWRERLPLRGRRIMVARAHLGASPVARSLRSLGGEVVELPHVERAQADATTFLAPARWPSRVDLVVLPSVAAARALYASAPPHVRQASAVAIDALTFEEARRSGASCARSADVETAPALVLAAVRALSERFSSGALAGAPVASQGAAP
jgi:uroporphyrinogen III methyltransferase/synthase